MSLLHLVVDHLAPWRWGVPNSPHPSSTTSSPLISDLGKGESWNLGLVANILLCGDVEQNPDPPGKAIYMTKADIQKILKICI